jgi:anaerobic ribonucleoside-triphosphate reductase activating protein
MKTTARHVLVHRLYFPVRVLGPGVRAGLWFQGCARRCDGCLTPESWDFDAAKEKPIGEVSSFILNCCATRPKPEGVTVSGGEPFDQPEALLAILRELRAARIGDVLIYTSYLTGELTEKYPDLPRLAAAIIDGPFDKNSPAEASWKGSENQTLTILKPRYKRRYELWERTTKRKMQLAGDERGVFVIGIPRAPDAEYIKNNIGGASSWN